MTKDNRIANKISSTPETTSDGDFLNALREARIIGRRLRAVARAKYKAVMEPARTEREAIETQAWKNSRQARENASLHQKARLEAAREQMFERAAQLEQLHHVVIEKTEGKTVWKRVVGAATSLDSQRHLRWSKLKEESLAASFAAILLPIYESMNVEIVEAQKEYTKTTQEASNNATVTVNSAGRALGRLRNRTRYEGKAGRQAVWHRYLVHGNVNQLLAEMRELTTP